MRIAVVNRHVSHLVGGSEIQCDLIARGLVARGHDVRYLAVGSPAPVAGLPYDLRPVPHRVGAVVRAAIEATPHVLYWRLDRDLFAGAAVLLARAPFPFVYAVAHIDNLRPGVPRPAGRVPGARRLSRAGDALRRAWVDGTFRLVDGLVVNNPEHLGIVPVARQVHVPNGMVDTRAPFAWPRPYVAWVGSLKPPKRPEELVPLAAAVADLGVDVLVAGAVQDERYAYLARGRDLPANLHHLGLLGLAEVNGLLAGARCHVHTSLPEGFSNVMIQAWLQGRPTVSLGYDPDGAIGRHGLGAVAGDDPVRFRSEVRRLLADPAAADAAGLRARTFAAGRFDPDRAVERLESFLREVVAAS